MRPALLVACCLLLAAAPAATKPSEPLSCGSARAELEDYLDTFPRSCQRDSDCQGYYYRVDACAPAVVLRRHTLAGKREERLLALQHAMGEACTLRYRTRPACSPIPFRAACRKSRCVDLAARPSEASLAPEAAPAWPFATIRHACGPADGPALQITLTRVRNPGKNSARLFLTLYGNLPQPPLDRPRLFELTQMKDGDGVRCLRPNACESAERGQLRLEKFDGTGAEGSYELFFKDGSTERGRFKAAWEEVREFCG
jgi:hypothetical protein